MLVLLAFGCDNTPDPCGDGGKGGVGCQASGPDEKSSCAGIEVSVDDEWVGDVCVVCADGTCTYGVTPLHAVASMELDLAVLAEASWSEFHDAFSPVTSGERKGEWSLPLVLVGDAKDYASNQTSLFNLYDDEERATTGMQVSFVNEDGVYVNCVTIGGDPGWYGDDCTEETW